MLWNGTKRCWRSAQLLEYVNDKVCKRDTVRYVFDRDDVGVLGNFVSRTADMDVEVRSEVGR